MPLLQGMSPCQRHMQDDDRVRGFAMAALATKGSHIVFHYTKDGTALEARRQ